MKVLAELYECADLKLQLKFEIEVLLNSFNMKIKDIEQSTIIRNHNPEPTALARMFGISSQSVNLANEMTRLSLEGSQLGNNIQAPFPQQIIESKQFPGISQPQMQNVLQAATTAATITTSATASRGSCHLNNKRNQLWILVSAR